MATAVLVDAASYLLAALFLTGITASGRPVVLQGEAAGQQVERG